MKIEYFPDTDTLYIGLTERPSVESEEIADDAVVDFDEQGNVVGIEIEHASEKLDLTTLEAHRLPLTQTA
jgi:uncharacterized protein YuzE